MDPRGVVQDVHSTGISYDQSSGMLSPDKCAELVSALHTDTPKGKGLYFSSNREKSLTSFECQFDGMPLTEFRCRTFCKETQAIRKMDC